MTRALDVVLGGLALLVASPLMILAALLVRADSPGAVLFRQNRVGLHGQEFQILKFRTMRTGVDGPAITTAADPRITRVGAWLRSSKVDELPQLINVLRGEMSLVGPRPEVPEYVRRWPADARATVLSVRPGITDPASIRLRRESEMLARVEDAERYYIEVLIPQKVALYADYVESRSTWGDLRVLFRTVRAMLGI